LVISTSTHVKHEVLLLRSKLLVEGFSINRRLLGIAWSLCLRDLVGLIALLREMQRTL
jgi:hypothetical protein